MPRTTMVLHDPQISKLSRIKKRTGSSFGESIRRAIDAWDGGEPKQIKQPVRR